MNNVTVTLESQIKSFANSLAFISNEASELYKAYWATDTSALVGALASGTTAATVASALNKTQFLNGVTMLESLKNFFGNAAVSTSDYLATCLNLAHGSSVAGAALSQNVEDIGSRLKVIAANCLELKKQSDQINSTYNSSELSAVIGSFSASTIIFGCGSTKTSMLNGIVLVQQFGKLLTNQAVSTGDYQTSVTEWINK